MVVVLLRTLAEGRGLGLAVPSLGRSASARPLFSRSLAVESPVHRASPAAAGIAARRALSAAASAHPQPRIPVPRGAPQRRGEKRDDDEEGSGKGDGDSKGLASKRAAWMQSKMFESYDALLKAELEKEPEALSTLGGKDGIRDTVADIHERAEELLKAEAAYLSSDDNTETHYPGRAHLLSVCYVHAAHYSLTLHVGSAIALRVISAAHSKSQVFAHFVLKGYSTFYFWNRMGFARRVADDFVRDHADTLECDRAPGESTDRTTVRKCYMHEYFSRHYTADDRTSPNELTQIFCKSEQSLFRAVAKPSAGFEFRTEGTIADGEHSTCEFVFEKKR